MTTIELYGYAFFIFLLICLLMVLYNFLFSDMKRQKKLLDEKENKLLRLYQSVEEALDDFHDSVEKSHSEIGAQLKELGELHAETEKNMRGLAAHAPSRIERREAPQARRAEPAATPAAASGIQRPPATSIPRSGLSTPPSSIPRQAPARQQEAPVASSQPADEASEGISPPPAFRQVFETLSEQPEASAAVPGNRNEEILAMAEGGKSRSDIAKELGITLSEVDLVIGMSR